MNRSTLFWGFLLILVGVVFLLSNLGVITTGVSGLLWPLIMIAVGLWMLIGIVFGSKSQAGEQAVVPLDGAQTARVRIHHGAGRLFVDGNAGPGELVSGKFGGGLDYRARRSDERLELDMRIADRGRPWFWWPGGSLDWTVGLSREIPLWLDVNTGASEANLDLEELYITDFVLGTGASSSVITMPGKAGYTRARIESGAASVSIRIPEGVAARIQVQSGLSGIDVDQNRFPRSGGVYKSPDFESAQNKVDLDIQTGVASVSVR